MYTDEEVRAIKRDRDQSRQLNIYLLVRLFQMYKLSEIRDIKHIIYVDIEKTGLVYPELFSIINGKVK